MNFDGAEKIAAAILYEGYILYPYRPTAIKNRQRWNFGTLYPRIYAEAQHPPETFSLVAECIAVSDAKATLDVRISFLQLLPTQNADELQDPSLAWDEAIERTSDHAGLGISDLIASPLSLTLEMGTAGPPAALRSFSTVESGLGLSETADPSASLGMTRERTAFPWGSPCVGDQAHDFSGQDDNSVVKSSTLTEALAGTTELLSRPERSGAEGPAVRQNLQIKLSISVQLLQNGVSKLRLEVQNTSPLPSGAGAKREEALPLSLVSAHLLLGIKGGEFVSLLDPDPAYREAVAACNSRGVFPVLVGEEPGRSMMFCSPIILYDYPKVAPESEGDFFDGTEMDEMLTLRVLTLTDAEKQEMRSGDPRARKILERTEALSSEALLKAHGVIRGLREIRGNTP